MKKFYANYFSSTEQLAQFINNNNITKEQIVTINVGNGVQYIYYYA